MSEENRTPEQTEWREAFENAIAAAREAFVAGAEAAGKAIKEGSKIAEKTVEDAQRTVVISLENDTIAQVDKMVKAGTHKTRSDALRHLISLGIKTSEDLFSRTDEVEAQVTKLKDQFKETVVGTPEQTEASAAEEQS